MLNKIFLMGRLVKDPELRHTQSGLPVASFTLAVDRDYKDSSGQKQTDFIDIVAWRNTAEYVSRYFTKGRMAVVGGQLQLRDWTDKNGNKRRSAEVVADSVYFGDSRPSGQSQGQGGSPYGSYQSSYGQRQSEDDFGGYDAPPDEFEELDDDDSELPF